MHETPESETENANPLADLDEWEEDLLRRYPELDANEEDRKFRDYDADARPSVWDGCDTQRERSRVEPRAPAGATDEPSHR